MKLSLRTLRTREARLVLAAALGAVAALATSSIACSSADDGVSTSGETPPPVEGGVLPPAPDASAPVDAGSVDADAEAEAPRVCSDDGFCHTTLSPKATLRGVWADGAGVAWAVSDEGEILRHDGNAWTVHTKTKGALRAVWGSGPNDIWIGGDVGLLHGTGATSATLTFADANAPGDQRAPITSIWGTGAKDVWAVGNFVDFPYVARVLHYTDGFAGASWQVDGVSSSPVLFSRVWGTSTSGVWLAGLRNNPVTINQEVYVVRRSAGATKFAQVDLPRDPTAPQGVGELYKLADATVALDGTVWVMGRTNTSKQGFARGTTTDGVVYTWSFVATGPSSGKLFEFAWGKAEADQWIGGDYGRLKRWDGTSWTQAKTTISKFPDTTPLHAMWGDANGELWVVGDGIAMHRLPPKKN
jgi:hypothetical protein